MDTSIGNIRNKEKTNKITSYSNNLNPLMVDIRGSQHDVPKSIHSWLVRKLKGVSLKNK